MSPPAHTSSGAPPAASPSPVGTWEGTLAGASSGGVRLRFVFRGDGTGLFGWRERGADAPLSGQSPLRWRPDAAGRLALTLTPPAVPDAVSDTMILLFNRRPWAWNVDRARGRLTLGNLVFTGR